MFYKVIILLTSIFKCRKIILEEFTAKTNSDVALMQINMTKLNDGAKVDIDLNFLQKISNFYVSFFSIKRNFQFIFIKLFKDQHQTEGISTSKRLIYKGA